ncbi:MAG: hydantoinase/oxoprolinase family protein [Deltaproteobacteria bacterium]|nr:hydantoinase/oxoprolinase family protein [Deltaproteobacteria bacterium]
MKKREYIIYIDTGGTFTDCILVDTDGNVNSGKALTKPNNLVDSFFGSIKNALEKTGESIKDVLPYCNLVGYGTTLGTNIVVTRRGGPKLGFITTRGIEDRTIIMRQRAAGLSRVEAMHLISAEKVEPIITRPFIRGVTERIDSTGEIIIPLREPEVEQAVKELLDQGVQGIVVGLLWSFLNNSHEQRIKEIIQQMAPDMSVALSSEVIPVAREYPRFMSTIIDLYVGKPIKDLLMKIKNKLSENGYRRPFLIMQAIGGVANSDVVKPGTTLHSGPVGGMAGVEFLKNLYGIRDAVGSDVGGTSFDVCISSGDERYYLREPIVGRFEIATPMCEILTIGAGGGTIARFHEPSRTIRVGPDSAGGDPGPVCYGFGGTEPTVTDADVVMNRIDPEFFLGGKIKLFREKALRAIKEKIADPLGIKVEDAAESICRIIDGRMETLLESTLARKGIDPSKFVLFAYGGAGPVHCAGYSENLQFPRVIIPNKASVFSAFGASTTNVRHRHEASCYISIRDIPYDPVTLRFDEKKISLEQMDSRSIEKFNSVFEELDDRINSEMKAEGFPSEKVTMRYDILARYLGQLWELRVPVDLNHIGSSNDFAAILNAFVDRYQSEYGKEAMVPKAGLEIITVAAEGIGYTIKPKLIPQEHAGKDASTAIKGERDVYFNGEWEKTKIYDVSLLQAGNQVRGPGIIEAEDTTVVVPRNRKVIIDEYQNMIMGNT